MQRDKSKILVKSKNDNECIACLKSRWREILTTRFQYFLHKSPEYNERMNQIMDCMIQSLESIFVRFSDIKDTQFNTQIMNDDVGIYSQRMAEMLFYYRLLGMGFKHIESKDSGPDFIAQKNGETFCFEVVTPTPWASIRHLINEQKKLDPEDRNKVFRERLLSVTSAIKDKLMQFESHKAAGHVPEGASYIIVVNDSMLLPYDQPWYGVLGELCFGESTLPITVDATLGTGEVDFSENYTEETSGEDDVEYQDFIMRHSFSISINGSEAKTPEDSLLRVKKRKSIPTRKNTNSIAIDIAESFRVTGIYQITLREDLLFHHSFESGRRTMPPSALISSVENKQLLRDNILYSSIFAKDEALVQPHMSSAQLFGFERSEFNSMSVDRVFFEPFMEGGEFYRKQESQG